MSELKTLKDLESHSFDTGSNEWISIVELKAEAVKWVKEDVEAIKEGIDSKRLLGRWAERFNITEEDLK